MLESGLNLYVTAVGAKHFIICLWAQITITKGHNLARETSLTSRKHYNLEKPLCQKMGQVPMSDHVMSGYMDFAQYNNSLDFCLGVCNLLIEFNPIMYLAWDQLMRRLLLHLVSYALGDGMSATGQQVAWVPQVEPYNGVGNVWEQISRFRRHECSQGEPRIRTSQVNEIQNEQGVFRVQESQTSGASS